MLDTQLVPRVERLRDSVESLRDKLISRYRNPNRLVLSRDLRKQAATLGELWLVEISVHHDIQWVVGSEIIADLNVAFQRLITYSETSTVRRRYDSSFEAILDDFRNRVVIPLKQHRHVEAFRASSEPPGFRRLSDARSAFVGQSFASKDQQVNRVVHRVLRAMDIDVITGERPSAGSVSTKVKRRIEKADIFVGVFTRRDRHSRRRTWSTSVWIIDEKAYALAKAKRLILIKEDGVASIGGLQGDYEYLKFSRVQLEDLVLGLLETLVEL